MRAAGRAELFPVRHIEPMEPNREAFGFDVGSEPMRRAALEQARGRGRMTATGRIRLVQREKGGYGFLVFYPVFVETPSDTDDRWAGFVGFMLGVFSVDEIMRGSLAMGAAGAEWLTLDVFDESGEREVSRLYPAGAPATVPVGDRVLTEKIEVAGRVWRVFCTPKPGSPLEQQSSIPWLALVAGLALTGIAALYVHTILNRADRIERLVAARTLELSLANQALQIENNERRRLETQLRESYMTVEKTVQQRTHQLEQRNELLRETFGLYVDDEVVEDLLQKEVALGGEKRWVTMLACDLRGFSSFSERHSPEQVVSMLNHYFDAMVDIIHQYRGSIVDFVGDAILALFGAPLTTGDDARRACACAVAMQNGMSEANRRTADLGLPTMFMGIGIASGEAVVGHIGAARRRKFAAVGSVVNLASRIETFTLRGQALISETTRKEVGPVLEVGQQFHIDAKGFTNPLLVCEILSVGALRMPNRFEPPLPVQKEIPVCCRLVTGKAMSPDEMPGILSGVSPDALRLELGQSLEPLAEIHITIRPPGVDPITDVYGKVVPSAEAGVLIGLTTTSVTLDDWIHAVLGRERSSEL